MYLILPRTFSVSSIADILCHSGLLTLFFLGVSLKTSDTICTAWIILFIPIYVILAKLVFEYIYPVFVSENKAVDSKGAWYTICTFFMWFIYVVAGIILLYELETKSNPQHHLEPFMFLITLGLTFAFLAYGEQIFYIFLRAFNNGGAEISNTFYMGLQAEQKDIFYDNETTYYADNDSSSTGNGLM